MLDKQAPLKTILVIKMDQKVGMNPMNLYFMFELKLSGEVSRLRPRFHQYDSQLILMEFNKRAGTKPN